MTDRIPQDLDDAVIDAALESASLPALLPALIHLTLDTGLLTRFGQRFPGPKGDDGAGIPEESGREIRSLAAQALRSLRNGRQVPATPLSDSQHMAMISWSVGEQVPAEYLQLLLEEAYFDDRDLRRFQWSASPPSSPSPQLLALKDFRAAIIGSGASATQIAPAIVGQVEKLSIFQRTRNWLLPNSNYHRPQSCGRRREQKDGLAAPARSQLLQQQQGARHHQRAVAAH